MRFFALIFLGVLVTGFGTASYFFLREAPQVPATSPMSEREAAALAEGRYFNQRYGFSFILPEGAEVHERKEGSDAASIRIERIEENLGFQVFVVKYEGSSISEERFLMDVTSGVREQEEHIRLDGVDAIAFLADDLRLGVTREVWVLHRGYLYEISAPISSEEFLHTALSSWVFENQTR